MENEFEVGDIICAKNNPRAIYQIIDKTCENDEYKHFKYVVRHLLNKLVFDLHYNETVVWNFVGEGNTVIDNLMKF